MSDFTTPLPKHAQRALLAVADIERAILTELNAVHDAGWCEYACVGLKHLEDSLRLPKEVIRGVMANLRHKGFAAHKRGLMTEDGDLFGSGYHITAAGHAELQGYEADHG
jgi:hypothetical protein